MQQHFTLSTATGRSLAAVSRISPAQLLAQSGTFAVYSGGFDPLHEGHISCIQAAVQRYGAVILIANADGFLQRKRQNAPHMVAPLLPRSTRLATLAALSGVALVVEAIDDDQTVVETIAALASVPGITISHFVNGGDRTPGTVPEESVCRQYGIDMVWGCGGGDKLQESSMIVERAAALGALHAYDHQQTRWGSFCTVAARLGAKHKLLSVYGGTGLSLQTHQFRSETWRCLSGTGRVALGQLDAAGQQLYLDGQPVVGQSIDLVPGTRVSIACQQAHMVYAAEQEPLIISEWQYGDCLEESDINRFGDPFHQAADIDRCRPWLHSLRVMPAIPRESLVAAQ